MLSSVTFYFCFRVPAPVQCLSGGEATGGAPSGMINMAGWLLPCFMLAMFILAPGVHADYLGDVGFGDLQAELVQNELAVPDGAGVVVAQIESGVSDGDYLPNRELPAFEGKTFEDLSGLPCDGTETDCVSGHAGTVGQYFYGSTLSMAGGITNIHIYEASYWMYRDYLGIGYRLGGNPIQPVYDINSSNIFNSVLSSPARVMNHSWVGSTDNIDADVLRRIDFVAGADQSIQVAAVNNGSTQKALVSGAYNAITVGRTDGAHATGTVAVDDLYTAGRTCPLIVVPTTPTSYTAPVVSAACALLIQTGADDSVVSLTDPAATAFTDRSGNIIRTAASSTLVKAALMAGARRVTQNTTDADITGYRSDPDGNQTDSGLDSRYGAGQLNVFNSYHILSGGEFDSLEDNGASGGAIDGYGFDVDPAFGGKSGSNRQARYYFTAAGDQRRLYATLAWRLAVDGGSFLNWDGTAELYDLDFFLYDISNPDAPVMVAASESRVDNTENLWTPLVPGRRYLMEVTAAPDQADFNWNYALAWRMDTPPDSDSDGIPDDWEVQFGLDHTDPLDASEDEDGDGLDNGAEYMAGTGIRLPDTDGDGVSDSVEINQDSDPLDSESFPGNETVPTASMILLLSLLGGLFLLGIKIKK
jgi:hypothetical protein